MDKVIVTITKQGDVETAKDIGGEILAEYPDALLMRVNQEQQTAMSNIGLEVNRLKEPEIEITGHKFNLIRAMEAEAASPAIIDPTRMAYFLVKLVGPVKEEWLNEIANLEGVVKANMQGFTLLVGLMPDKRANLEQLSWVEGITPYRPSMKISPKLSTTARFSPSASELALDNITDIEQIKPLQVEINVFESDNVEMIEQTVSNSGGTVLTKGENSVTAIVPPHTVNELSRKQEVQSIVPFNFPKLHNDKARKIIGVSDANSFGGTILTGANQIVAVCDSGLDNGDEENIHLDFRGRILAIHSFPVPLQFSQYTNDPPGHNEGAADTGSAHGTHVAGSVLGSGAAAFQEGSVLDGDLTPFPNPINNVQQIEIFSSNQEYEVRVRGVSVIQSSPRAISANMVGQDFALVVSNASPVIT